MLSTKRTARVSSRLFTLVLSILGFITAIDIAYSCDICSVFVAEKAQGTSVNPLQFGISEQYTHFGTLKNDGDKVSNDADQFLNSSITQVFAGYQLSDDIGFQLNVPIIYRSFRRATDTSTEKSTESGLGDLSILAKYTASDSATETGTFHLNFLAGLKLPSGSTSRLREELSETDTPPGGVMSGIHGHDLTLGSGSYDFILGATEQVTLNRFVVPAFIQYAYRTRGRYNYRFANEFTWRVAPGYYALLDHSRSAIVAIAVSGELKGKDDLDGVVAEDTGMKSVSIGPQLTYTLGEKLSANVGIDLPVVTRNTSFQIVPDSRIRISISVQL